MNMHSFLCKGNNEIESFPKCVPNNYQKLVGKKYVPKLHEDSGNRLL